MPKLGYYVPGDHNATCDQCGRGFKFSELKKRWDGAIVDKSCFEVRHPQDFVRAVKDDPSVPISRPRIIGIATSTLAAGISATATSLTLATGDGALFPSTASTFFIAMLQDVLTGTLIEMIKVTTRVGDSFTVIERGYLGTTPRAYLTSDIVTQG